MSKRTLIGLLLVASLATSLAEGGQNGAAGQSTMSAPVAPPALTRDDRRSATVRAIRLSEPPPLMGGWTVEMAIPFKSLRYVSGPSQVWGVNMRRDNFRRSFGNLRFSPRPRTISGVRQLTYEGTMEYIENSDQLSVEAGRSYERLVRPFEVSRGVVISAGGYAFGDMTAKYVLGQQRRASGTVSLQAGQFYDGTIRAVSLAGARVSVTKQLSVEPSLSINHVDVPAGSFTSEVLRARTDCGSSD